MQERQVLELQAPCWVNPGLVGHTQALTGIRAPDVEPAEAVHGGCGQPLQVGLPPHVASHGQGSAVAELSCQLLRPLQLYVYGRASREA